MYLKGGRTYYQGSQQMARRGLFLILMQTDSQSPIRAIVRKVAMQQLGQFMMGTARIAGHSVILSGSYGGDGLPVNVPSEVYQMGMEVPGDLIEQWNHGGGWNSAGSEAPAMKTWAIANLKQLSPRR